MPSIRSSGAPSATENCVTAAPQSPSKPRRRWGRLLVGVLCLFGAIALFVIGTVWPERYAMERVEEGMQQVHAAAQSVIPESHAFSEMMDSMEGETGVGIPVGAWEAVIGNRRAGRFMVNRLDILPDGRFRVVIGLMGQSESGKGFALLDQVQSVGLVQAKGRVLHFRVAEGATGIFTAKGRVGVKTFDHERSRMTLILEAGSEMHFSGVGGTGEER